MSITRVETVTCDRCGAQDVWSAMSPVQRGRWGRYRLGERDARGRFVSRHECPVCAGKALLQESLFPDLHAG